jgi:hypothetical protein
MKTGHTLSTRLVRVTDDKGDFLEVDNHLLIFREKHLIGVEEGHTLYEVVIENPFDNSLYTQYRTA